jgi:3-dehydroquinate synthase
MGVIKDQMLFENLERHVIEIDQWEFYGRREGLNIIERSITGMVEELHDNLRELDLERLVDFGHSFSPLLELRSLDAGQVRSLSHGEAVALDVLFSSCLATNRGILSIANLKRIFSLCHQIGLPIEHPFFNEADYLWEALEDTTRHRNGNQNLPIPNEVGKGQFVNDLTYDELLEIITLHQSQVRNIGK